MKIVIIGVHGAAGGAAKASLEPNHEVIALSRNTSASGRPLRPAQHHRGAEGSRSH